MRVIAMLLALRKTAPWRDACCLTGQQSLRRRLMRRPTYGVSMAIGDVRLK
jgi:hypothetical protein